MEVPQKTYTLPEHPLSSALDFHHAPCYWPGLQRLSKQLLGGEQVVGNHTRKAEACVYFGVMEGHLSAIAHGRNFQQAEKCSKTYNPKTCSRE